jgi:MFS family permease
VYRELALTPALVGTALSLGSFGVLAGAFAAAPLARRFGVGPVIILSMLIDGPALLLMVLLPSAAIVAGGMLAASGFVTGFSAVVYNVNQVSFRQAITPLDMQCRSGWSRAESSGASCRFAPRS